MIDLLAVSGISLVLSLLLTPLARVVARHCGLVDKPDGRRKLHSRVIPVAGGPVVLISVALTLLLALAWSVLWKNEESALMSPPLLGLLIGGSLICLVGVFDDFGVMRGRHKLLGQIGACLVVMCFGVRVSSIHVFGSEIDLGLLSGPFTIFLLLGAINSLNLIDGMDGLLSTVGLTVCIAMGVIALFLGQSATAMIAFALAGALLGFLRYNFPPATIYLGDSGSMLIGLAVGVLAIQSSLKGPATLALAAPCALLILPIFDTSAAIIRRKLTGRSLFCTDRGHLHHCLLRRGLSVTSALVVVSILGVVAVTGAISSVVYKNEWLAVIGALAVVSLLSATKLFGHAEFKLLHQTASGMVRSLLRGPRRPKEMEVRLQGSMDWKELWQELVATGPALDLVRIRLDVNAPAINEGYHARWERMTEETETVTLWKAEIPLAVGGRVIGSLEVAGRRDNERIARKIATLARMVSFFEETAEALTEDAWGVALRGHEPAVASTAASAAAPTPGYALTTASMDA